MTIEFARADRQLCLATTEAYKGSGPCFPACGHLLVTGTTEQVADVLVHLPHRYRVLVADSPARWQLYLDLAQAESYAYGHLNVCGVATVLVISVSVFDKQYFRMLPLLRARGWVVMLVQREMDNSMFGFLSPLMTANVGNHLTFLTGAQDSTLNVMNQFYGRELKGDRVVAGRFSTPDEPFPILFRLDEHYFH